MPDEEIFGDIEFNYDTLLKRIRELAYLNAGLKISFRDDRSDKKEAVPVRRRHQGLHQASQ